MVSGDDYDGGAMGGGYTKLWSSIIHSTVWREPMHVKVVWITMLAMSDRDGLVLASLPGLADAARVSLSEAEEALAHLSAPDEYSRTKEHEGRRIEACDGGWLLLNHAKYRALGSAEERREQVKNAVRRHRARVSKSNQSNPGKAQAEADPDANTEAEKKRESPPPDGDGDGLEEVEATPSKPKKLKTPSWTAEAVEDWIERWPDSEPNYGKIGGGLKKIVTRLGWPVVRPAWKRYLAATEAKFVSAPRFAETFSEWNGTAAPARQAARGGFGRPSTETIIDQVNAALAQQKGGNRG